MKLIDRPYIKRVSFLGGECLAENNLDEVLLLIKQIRISFPEKSIWLYTGYTWEKIVYQYNSKRDKFLKMRKEIVSNVDVLIDGEYIDKQRDITLPFRGSSNQRVIDVQKSLEQGKVVLHCD